MSQWSLRLIAELALLTDNFFHLGKKLLYVLHICVTLQVNYANITVLKSVLIWWSLPFIKMKINTPVIAIIRVHLVPLCSF